MCCVDLTRLHLRFFLCLTVRTWKISLSSKATNAFTNKIILVLLAKTHEAQANFIETEYTSTTE